MARPQLDIDFFEPSFLQDPYATYDRIRDLSFGPVWNAALHGWMVVGYDEGSTVIADTARFRSRNDDPEITPWFEAPNMIAADGDLHKRLRGALAPMFTRSASARWEARINEVVAAMLEPLVAGNDSFDLIADFTKVPTIIVSEMLGIPRSGTRTSWTGRTRSSRTCRTGSRTRRGVTSWRRRRGSSTTT